MKKLMLVMLCAAMGVAAAKGKKAPGTGALDHEILTDRY